MLSTTHSVSPSEVAPQTSPPSGPGGGPQKPNENKGELRIKRKKARRACFSCQRAHLTCGMAIINYFLVTCPGKKLSQEDIRFLRASRNAQIFAQEETWKT